MFKTLIYFLTAFAVMMSGSNAFALDVPAKPDNGWYIRDTAGKISEADIKLLNDRIEAFNKATRNEIGVLIIPTLGDASLEDYSKDVFHSWGIGKAGLDNGILLLIAANDHKMRIETGKGAEGDVPDAKVLEITGDMKPYLRKNDYAGAVGSVVDNLTKIMEDRTGQKAIVGSTTPGANASDVSSDSFGIIFALIVAGGLGIMAFCFWLTGRNDKKRREEDYNIYKMRSKEYKDTYCPPPLPPKRVYTAPSTYRAPTVSKPTAKKPAAKKSSSSGSSSSGSSSSSSYSPSDYSGGGGDGGGFGGGDSGGGGGSDSW